MEEFRRDRMRFRYKGRVKSKKINSGCLRSRRENKAKRAKRHFGMHERIWFKAGLGYNKRL